MPEIPSYALPAAISAQDRKATAIARLKARNAPAASPKVKPAPAAPKAKGSTPWSPEIAASPAAKAATQRALDVAGSPHFEANRDLAVQLLGNPKLSGAEILACLALAGSKSRAHADAALAEMKAALSDAAENNPKHGGTKGAGTARAARIWESAYARTFGEAGE